MVRRERKRPNGKAKRRMRSSESIPHQTKTTSEDEEHEGNVERVFSFTIRRMSMTQEAMKSMVEMLV